MAVRFIILVWLTFATTAQVQAGLFDFFGKDKAAAKVEAPKPKPISYETQVKPLLSDFCFDCHGGGTKKGGIVLDEYANTDAMMRDLDTWKRVAENVHNHQMPPEKKTQPTPAQRDLITAWVDREVFKCDCNNPDPGRVTIHRLNRQEYNNTIRDLVGVDFSPADDFPADDSGYGFDNIGDVLSIPPVLLEKYLAAAEKIMDEAIVTGKGRTPVKHFGKSRLTGGDTFGEDAKILVSNSELTLTNNFLADGEYIIRTKAFGQQAGKEPAKMGVLIAGKQIATIDVKAEEKKPEYYETKARFKKGEERIAVSFLNDFYDEKVKNPNRRDRNLIIINVDIEGPLNVPPPLPPTHTRIFTRLPASPQDRSAAAREIVGNFARKAYRRPVTKEELDRLMVFDELAKKQGDSFEQGVKLALEAVLISPHFLFRGEVQPSPDNPASVHPIDEYALASRLSYFLWSSMPDEELLSVAQKGTLRRDLAYQVQRMIKDPKSHAFVQNFAGQWLQIRNLDLVTPDRKMFPDFTDQLRDDMRHETELFFENIMREDRSILEFLTADYSFINERLAKHYGIENIKGEQFQKISLKGSNRSGIMTQGSILTITSNPTRTSPVKRGLWVLENLLASPPPPPPPNVPPLKDDREGEAKSASLRERLELHRKDAGCAACHARMDPLGFGLENFDAVGGFRTVDAGFKIDPSGKLVSGEMFNGPTELNQILLNSKKDQFVNCIAEKMLTYALGRGMEYYDKCALESISKGVVANRYKFSALILEVVKSVPFQMRRGDGERLAKAEAVAQP